MTKRRYDLYLSELFNMAHVAMGSLRNEKLAKISTKKVRVDSVIKQKGTERTISFAYQAIKSDIFFIL
jgi:hypothetical protein